MSQSSFKYPPGGLLQVKGVVSKKELLDPKQRDANGDPCLLVIKNGTATGVTLGRGTGLQSIVRTYNKQGVEATSWELAIYPYDKEHAPFSQGGDSGSIVVDGEGQIVGMITGGTNGIQTSSADVTYVTPYHWLQDRIAEAFPNSFHYPIQK